MVMPGGAQHGHLLPRLERRQPWSNETRASPVQLSWVPGIPAAHEIQLLGLLGRAVEAGQVLSCRLGPAVAWELLGPALLGVEGNKGTPRLPPDSGGRMKVLVVLGAW